MVLDSLTILFALAPLSLMVGVVLYLVWLRQRAEPGLRLWALSLMLRVPAFLLLSARGQIPDVWSIAVANGILLVGVGLGVKATRSFGRRATPMVAVLLPCTIWGVLCFIPGIYDNDQNRLIAVTLLQATCSGIIAFEFTRSVVGGRKVCLALAGLIGAMTLVQLVRAGIAAMSSEPIVLAANNAPLAATIYLQLIAVFLGGLFAATIFLDAQLKDLRRQASEDSLTGALNREAFQSRSEAALVQAHQDGAEAVLLAIDLDRFKALNDIFGHGEGDRVLALFGERLRGLLPEGALFGRIGGDEFAVLVVGEATRQATGMAAKICGLLGRSIREPEHRGTRVVTASVGLARAEAGESLAMLMARADAALYDAKRDGRGRVSIAEVQTSRGDVIIGDFGNLQSLPG
ncbi:GGDEF domain-containing protein [Pannonibacter carbonis]|uniref:GGDEF domain-containing protein n=1 Tax=Pannonibacter carbonis TaxID=2067569 RepID=UPI001300B6C6|nr:GGDEF domain-containing protein [Pannonibacter carbonis]